jgi:cystathionine beta-lyase/cystathionine gamma-synthase
LLETRVDRASGAFEGITYGREGTPTTRAFEEAITELEGGYRAVTLPCGLGAIATSLIAFLKSGDHLLMPGVPTYPSTLRSSTRWDAPGPSVRIHVGLENVDDLVDDLERGFARLRAAA